MSAPLSWWHALYIYICIYVCMYIYIDINIYTHIYIHCCDPLSVLLFQPVACLPLWAVPQTRRCSASRPAPTANRSTLHRAPPCCRRCWGRAPDCLQTVEHRVSGATNSQTTQASARALGPSVFLWRATAAAAARRR